MSLTEEGLGCEASGKHRQALLEGLGSIEESKTVNSTAVKPKAIGQEEDGEMLEETAKTSSGAWWRLARSDVHYAAKEICIEEGEPDTEAGPKVQDGVQIPEGSGGDVGDAGSETHDCITVDVQRGLGLGRRAQ